jgi:hypothetical protein
MKNNESMPGNLVSLLIEFALQTVILFGLLWGMIKIQKLDQRFSYKFLGLVGAAALATILEQVLQMVLGRFIGIYFASYITTPIVLAVLLLCLKKITGAPYIDVVFTVAISYALLFGVNLFILSSLMGELRPSGRTHDDTEIVTPRPGTKGHTIVVKTNLPASKPTPSAPAPATNPVKPEEKATPKMNPLVPAALTNLVKPVEKTAAPTNPPAPVPPATPVKPVEKTVPATNLPAPAAVPPVVPATNKPAAPATPASIVVTNPAKATESAAPKLATPAPAATTNVAPPPKPAVTIAKYFILKGVTRNAAKSAVSIQVGTKIYTIFLGETDMTQTPDGPIPVRFKELGDDWVILEINGESIQLPAH